MHPNTVAILRHFRFDHLRAELAEVSRPFAELAQNIARTLPADPETTVALRKLLEAKDCAVRARLAQADITPPKAEAPPVRNEWRE